MKVRLKTQMAGPSGCVSPGTVIDVTEKAGADLIAGGYAVAIDRPRADKAPVPDASNETATVDPKENAAGEPQRNGWRQGKK